MIGKVLAYITRDHLGETELLVFEHVDAPEAGLQVPAGTIDNGETPEDAVLREIKEETGLTLAAPSRKLGEYEWFRRDRNEMHLRHVFHFPTTIRNDEWFHTVESGGEDRDLEFRLFWIPLSEAREKLAVDQGKYLWE